VFYHKYLVLYLITSSFATESRLLLLPLGNNLLRPTSHCHRVDISRLQHKDPAEAQMPHQDNLYSVEESDNESFSDELSPADGYFNRGQISAQAMVPDPSIEDSKEPEAKTLIPPHLLESMGRDSRVSPYSSSLPSQSYASAHSAGTSVPSRSSYMPTSPVSSRRLDDLFPRRPASMNGPPPAYTPSPEPTSSPTQEPSQPSQPNQPNQPIQPIQPPPSQPVQPSQQSPPSPITYNTFPEQHLERGFLPRREEPESMGSPDEIPSESTPLSRSTRRRSPCRNFLRKLLHVALVFTVTITILTAIFGGSKSVSSSFPDQVQLWPIYDLFAVSGGVKQTSQHI
jgi:hypothetical protein